VERSLLDAIDPRVANDARDGEEVLLDTLSLHLVPAEAPECRLVSVGKAGRFLVRHPLVLTCRVRPLLLCGDPLVALDQVLHPRGVGPLDVEDGVVVVVGERNPGVRPLFLVLLLREGHHRPVVLEVDARSLGRARHRDECVGVKPHVVVDRPHGQPRLSGLSGLRGLLGRLLGRGGHGWLGGLGGWVGV
jgi:hypothetical protein